MEALHIRNMWIGVMLAVYAIVMCASGLREGVAAITLVDQFIIILCALASVVDLRLQAGNGPASRILLGSG